MFSGMQYISIHPRSVAVNHAGLWIRRHQFESGRGYTTGPVLLYCSPSRIFCPLTGRSLPVTPLCD